MRIGGGDSDPIPTYAVDGFQHDRVQKEFDQSCDTDPPEPGPDRSDALVASFGVKRVHTHLGCPAPWTAVQVGGGSSGPGSDVFFLDFDKKVRSIRRVLAAETQQEIGDAISFPIQDVLDLANISNINRCVSFYHNDHYILAFPIDGATKYDRCHNPFVEPCGEWAGWPRPVSRAIDLGDYSKMIFARDGVNVSVRRR